MTQDKTPASKKSFSVDWLLRGTLTKVGDIFDRFTGRGWKPSSSIATSELTERLKKLLDSEVKDTSQKGKFVPHNIKLKMQWDKFSTDAEEAMKKLEYELLTAIIDHINDNRYHTYAPIKLEIKPDYFTEGVKLLASFDKFADEGEAELNVTVPNLKNIVIPPPVETKPVEEEEIFAFEFSSADKPKTVELSFTSGQRRSIGRTKENALSIDDPSVSKIHGAFVLNSENQLMVADTGSTNGTFINGTRMAYGKAFPLADGDKIKFGTVEVVMIHVTKKVEEIIIEPEPEDVSVTDTVTEIDSMKTREDFGKTDNLSLKTNVFPQENLSQITTVLAEIDHGAGAKTFVENVETPAEKPAEKPVEKPSEKKVEEVSEQESLPKTEQGIILDFGENK